MLMGISALGNFNPGLLMLLRLLARIHITLKPGINDFSTKRKPWGLALHLMPSSVLYTVIVNPRGTN